MWWLATLWTAGLLTGWLARGAVYRRLRADLWKLIESHQELERENAALRRQINRSYVPYVRVERGH
jgi:hypothetical protein